ncbi:MAG: PH domain-containing protein [Anaerolineae bacterium]
MDHEVQRAIQGELMSGEKLLWAGRPRRGLVLRSGDVYTIPLGFLYLGFAVFWETWVTLNGVYCFTLFGAPILLAGLYVAIGRFILDIWKRAQSYYGVTDRRVIIVTRLLKLNVKSLDLHALGDFSWDKSEDGRGTITFGSLTRFAWWTRTWPGTGAYSMPCFEMIPDVQCVYEIIRGARRQT